MIKSSCKRNRNVPFGRMAVGGGDGREPTDGIKGIVAGESNGIGEIGADDDTGGGGPVA